MTNDQSMRCRAILRERCGPVAVGLLAVLALGACQSGTATNTTVGKTFVYATSGLPASWDPCFQGAGQAEIRNNLYAQWTYYKVGPLPDGTLGDSTSAGEASIAPNSGIVASWDLSADGAVYTLHLRHGAKDSYGNEMTADDMKWELDRLNNTSSCSYVTKNMRLTDVSQQVSVLDKYTLKAALPGPDPIFLRMLSDNDAAAIGPEVRKHTTSADPWGATWLKANAPATGPYKVQSFTPGVEVTLTVNPNYFGKPPAIATITYKEVDSPATRVAVLLSGQVQGAGDLSQDDLNQIAQNPKASVACAVANDELNLASNASARGPMSNPAVRQALAYAIPYDDIVKSVYNGRAKRLYGMVPGMYPPYLGDSAFPYTYDLAKAKQVLTSAGYANGFTTGLLIVNSVPEHERVAVLIQNSLKQIGVTLNIDKQPQSAYRSAIFGVTYPGLAIWQNHSLVIDTGYHASLFLPSNPPPGLNWSGYYNSQLSALIAQAPTLPDGAQRNSVLNQVQTTFNDQLPWIPLANTPACFAFAKNVSGYTWHTFNTILMSDLKYTS